MLWAVCTGSFQSCEMVIYTFDLRFFISTSSSYHQSWHRFLFFSDFAFSFPKLFPCTDFSQLFIITIINFSIRSLKTTLFRVCSMFSQYCEYGKEGKLVVSSASNKQQKQALLNNIEYGTDILRVFEFFCCFSPLYFLFYYTTCVLVCIVISFANKSHFFSFASFLNCQFFLGLWLFLIFYFFLLGFPNKE